MRRGAPRQRETLGGSAITQWLLILTALSGSVAVAMMILFVPRTADVMLQYNVYFGVSARAPWWGPYAVVGSAFGMIVINYILAILLYRQKERIASYTLLIGGFLVMVTVVVMSIALAFNN